VGGAVGTHRRGRCLLRLLTGEALSTRRSRLYPRMLILGIETATPQVSVAIGGHEGVIGLFEVLRGRRHAETLTPAIEFVCRQADVDIAEFGAVAIDIGPGLFTGMRVGLASAKAIAQALRVPMIGITSLDLLAFPLRHADRTIAAVIDARKGELFYAFYRPVPGGLQRVTEPAVGTCDDLVADLMARNQNVVCVGDGALLHRDEISGALPCDFAEQFLQHPSAAPLVQLAHARALREEWVNPRDIQPMYLRAPDAQINWSTRASGSRGAR
jgi:tRNA threonylcarbamoyladenosine biosynthesis protein TsaB